MQSLVEFRKELDEVILSDHSEEKGLLGAVQK